MKCSCGLEMELWQTTRVDGVVVKRYRCVCGLEKSVIEDKPQDTRPEKKNKE